MSKLFADNNYIKLHNKRLIRYLIQDWKRVSTRLLHLAEDISYLDLFWRSGFDITHILPKDKAYEQYHSILGPKVELVQANKQALPFTDESFDYTVILYSYKDLKSFSLIVNEAFRLSSKGIIIVDWNKRSLAGFKHNFASPNQIKAAINNNMDKAVLTVASCLLGPSSTWHHKSKFKAINKLIMPCSLGAVVGYKIDFTNFAPITTQLFAKNNVEASANASMGLLRDKSRPIE